MRLTNCIAAPLALMLAVAAFGDDDAKDTGLELTIGDEAPAIDIAHWIKGDEVKEFEEGKVYVVEFWATWCGPCRASMPHISELQEKLKDYKVTIIGVSDEPLQTVARFLFEEDGEGAQWWDKTRYTLTTDPDRSVFQDYMKAAGQRFIPTAFVVGKDGHVEWIGSPRDIDSVLEDVVHDRWDRAASNAEFQKRMAGQAKTTKLEREFEEARKKGDWKQVHAVLDEFIAMDEANPAPKMQKFLTYVGAMNDATTGYAYGEKIAQEHWDDPQFLNQIAWYVVDRDGIQTRNLEFAKKLADRANELTDGEDGAILDTVARVYYEMGDIDKAVEYQRKAVEHATPQFEGQLKEALEKYEAEAKARAALN